MAFSREHDAWIRQGLLEARFTLHVVAGQGGWGQVEDTPVDVYYCDFLRYDPPEGFPTWDVCCIRTETAWWIVWTLPLYTALQEMAQNGELAQGFGQTVTLINQRQIGAWLLVRDQGVAGEVALEQMDQRLAVMHGDRYRKLHRILQRGLTPEEYYRFTKADSSQRPMDRDMLAKEIFAVTAWHDERRRRSNTEMAGRLSVWYQRLELPRWSLRLAIVLLLMVIVLIEAPRMGRLYGQVYGPRQVDLPEVFPTVRWVDETGEALFQQPVVSRALYQALHWRNPARVATPVVEVSLEKLQPNPEASGYRWSVVSDEITEQAKVSSAVDTFSSGELRAWQNEISGYKSLRFILAYKFVMKWGQHGRFIMLFVGLCLGVWILTIRRALRRAQELVEDTHIHDHAAGGKILESVAQDPHAAENLLLFNQERRLRMHDGGDAEDWEQEAFNWIEQNMDLETGQTRHQQRNEALSEKRKKRI